MKGRFVTLCLLLCLVIVPVCAAEITLSTDQKDWYFSLGENADIPLKVTSGYSQPVDGTMQFTTIEQLQNTGSVMLSTKNRVYAHSVSPGDSSITLNAGSSDVEKSMRVQVSFDYTVTTPIHVTLPEIIIHFVTKPPASGGSQAPVTSSSEAGSGNTPTSSSVQIVQQSVSAQQQAGRDGTLQQAVSNNQLPQDATALKEQLEKEAREKEQQQSQFEENLRQDPLLKAANESLAAEGFSRESIKSAPESGDSGTFQMDYRKATGEQVTVSGRMENRSVSSVQEQSGAPINVTAPLEANTTFQSMAAQLAEQGFLRNETHLNLSTDRATINLTYQDEKGKRVFVNASTSGGNLTQLTLEREPETPVNYLPVIAVIVFAAVILAICWLIYRRYLRWKVPAPGTPGEPPAPRAPVDHRKAAAELLRKAEAAYAGAQYADAGEYAGQALRLFVAYEYGARREMTNSELITLLRAGNREFREIQSVLDRCTDVLFAKGTMDAQEFAVAVAFIRRLIAGSG